MPTGWKENFSPKYPKNCMKLKEILVFEGAHLRSKIKDLILSDEDDTSINIHAN